MPCCYMSPNVTLLFLTEQESQSPHDLYFPPLYFSNKYIFLGLDSWKVVKTLFQFRCLLKPARCFHAREQEGRAEVTKALRKQRKALSLSLRKVVANVRGHTSASKITRCPSTRKWMSHICEELWQEANLRSFFLLADSDLFLIHEWLQCRKSLIKRAVMQLK